MIVIVDNFDSFTFNIVHAYQQLGAEVKVLRNYVHLDEIRRLNPDLVVLGPGPGKPSNTGVCKQVLLSLAQEGIAIFGICLGHQLIGEFFGAQVVPASEIMHGKQSKILHKNRGVFEGLPQEFLATRYHSLLVENDLPDELELTAWSDAQEVMGVMHRTLPIEGVQFHPESIVSEQGLRVLQNSVFLYYNLKSEPR